VTQHPVILCAGSTDTDRGVYLALREIFTIARVSAVDHKSLGWRLYAFNTDSEATGEVMTEYEHEATGYRNHHGEGIER